MQLFSATYAQKKIKYPLYTFSLENNVLRGYCNVIIIEIISFSTHRQELYDKACR